VTTDTSTEQPISFVSETSQPRKQRRPGPANPSYAIPRSEWPTILRRVEQGESYRQIAQGYTVQGRNVSYQSIYRIIQALRKQQTGGQA
jgi:hypothetical protein